MTTFHEMTLHDEPFRQIATREKDIELRLYDYKRSRIDIFDYIYFYRKGVDKKAAGKDDVIAVQVIGLHILSDFATLYDELDLRRCGYSNPSEAHHRDMLKYYSQEELDEYAVIGIEVLLRPLYTVRNKEARINEERKRREFERYFPDGMK